MSHISKIAAVMVILATNSFANENDYLIKAKIVFTVS